MFTAIWDFTWDASKACMKACRQGFHLHPALEQVSDQSFYLDSHPAFLLTDNILGLSDLFQFSGPAEVCAVVILIAFGIVAVVQWSRCRRERETRQNISWQPAGIDSWNGMLALFAVQTIRQISSYTDTVPADSLDYYGGLGLGAGTEWLPDGGSQYAIDETERAIDSKGEGAYGVKYEGGKYFDVYIRLDREYYDMPYFYYKGYAAYLIDDSGNVIQKLPVEKAPAERHAYVRVLLPENGEGIGHVIVTYRKTAIQKIAYVVNAAFMAVVIAMAGAAMWRKKRWEKAKFGDDIIKWSFVVDERDDV